MIQLRDITLTFGSQAVFDHLSMNITPDQRIGLVGRNGSGKSTLLKAIDGLQPLDSGSIAVTGGLHVAYMPQEVVLSSSRTILDEAVSAYREVGPLRERALTLESQLENASPSLVEEYADIVHHLAELQVDRAIAETKKMLLGLGFKEEQFSHPVASLSVGWQMRIVLTKLLLQKADFYLFDEPTNHLDLSAKDWFLDFLKDMNCGFMLVCHDKYFLEELCSTILELDRGKGTIYYGNYTFYENEKEARLEALKQAHSLQQKEIQRKQEIVDRFKAKASKAKFAKSLQKTIDKIELIEPPSDARKVHFTFPPTERSGRVVLEVQNVSFSFDDKKIFDHVNFQIERGEKVALVAPNGMGKTTLFNVICGKYKQNQGNVLYGYNVKQTIFEQDQTKVLDPRKTVIEEVFAHTKNKTEQEIRTFLGAFLFGREEINKKTKVLSGGERNRLSMVKVLLQGANFLLLDEPTNHLDIPSKEILLKALQQFDGTLLFVSHDHDFVNHLATRILELTPEGVHSYYGNYELFQAQKKDATFLKAHSPQDQSTKKNSDTPEEKHSKDTRKNSFVLQKEQQRLEHKIQRLESDINTAQASFADVEYGTTEFDALSKKIETLTRELDQTTKNWEKIAQQVKQ